MRRSLGGAVFLTGVVLLSWATLTPVLVPDSSPVRHQPVLPALESALASTPTAERRPPKPRRTLPDTPAQSGSGTPITEVNLRPRRISIPALDIDRRLVPLGVLDDGSLAAPRHYADVGWWKDGPTPGAFGHAVVVGHLDSESGPAVFYGLTTLTPGDQIGVTRRGGSAVRFRVRAVERFPLAQFPADRVYRRSGPPGLVLITCGGTYDRAADRYSDNVVVFADQAAGSP